MTFTGKFNFLSNRYAYWITDDYTLKNSTHGRRMCIVCDLGIEENVNHIIMQCPANEMIRNEMFDAILVLPNDVGRELLADSNQTLLLLLGKQM